MKSARLVRRNHARYHQGRDDLNIVPMIDMMVILVFFLIFTAVFSKTNVLELNLPSSNPTQIPDLPKGLKLEVIIRPDDIVVNDKNSGPLGPNVPYDTLVQVMDTVRVYQLPVAPFQKAELFPDVSIGDAPI